jgi:hypothetical protein
MGKLVYKLEGLCCKILSQEYGLTDPLSLFDYTGACFFLIGCVKGKSKQPFYEVIYN